MPNEFKIGVSDSGELQFVYSDKLFAMLADLGESDIRRASHVEPIGKEWTADMSPVGGYNLGPFPNRAIALNAEISYLQERIGEL